MLKKAPGQQKHKPLNVGVVGATGIVGQTFLQLLEERQFPLAELRPFASDQSVGKNLQCQGKSLPVKKLEPGCFEGLDLVFFSSGDNISAEWAPQAMQAGAIVVDNSASFRMHKDFPLVVPEVNGHLLEKTKRGGDIIANPNCSAIQLVLVLKPLAEKWGLEHIHLATYQSVSGAGAPGVDELHQQRKSFAVNGAPQKTFFPHPILENCVPQIGSFQEQGFCTEEMKIREETRKLLNLPQLKISCFVARVPVTRSHAEAVWVTLKSEAKKEEILSLLRKTPGVIVMDTPFESLYPLQAERTHKNEVAVGRIHQDLDSPSTWLMWIVGDNIRKGAALNGIQIAERIFDISPAP